MKCPKCQSRLPETANFCLKCGQNLASTPTPTLKDLSFDEEIDKSKRYFPQAKTSVIGLCSLVKIPLWKEVKKLNFQSFNPTLGALLIPKQKQLSK